MHVSELWHSQSFGAKIARGALIPASLLYASGWEVYLACYSLGLKRAQSPHHPVICIGNLQVGGSGKTPFTRCVAAYLIASGYQVVISSSGYGSPRSEGATLAPPGPLEAKEWGDEAAMLRWLEPSLPLVVGRARVAAAEIVHRELPNHLLLMDDGFQHLPLQKDLTILLDPTRPPNRHCLPAGPYREPRLNRKRANLCSPGDLNVIKLPTRLVDHEMRAVEARSYSVLCALGNPDSFIADLNRFVPSEGGFERLVLKPDHDPLSEGTLLDSFSRDIPIVVTAKDWVKLKARGDVGERQFLIATQEIKIEPIEIIGSWLLNRKDT